jgi:hypothetical protein
MSMIQYAFGRNSNFDEYFDIAIGSELFHHRIKALLRGFPQRAGCIGSRFDQVCGNRCRVPNVNDVQASDACMQLVSQIHRRFERFS